MKTPVKSLLPSRLEIDAGMLMAAIHNRLWPSLWPAFEHCPLSGPCSSHQVADGRFPGLLARENSEGAAALPTVMVDQSVGNHRGGPCGTSYFFSRPR
jgi:hypothetical protein